MNDDARFYKSAWNTIFAPWWKLWLARLLGEGFSGRDGNCTVRGYYWRGKYYMTEVVYGDIGDSNK